MMKNWVGRSGMRGVLRRAQTGIGFGALLLATSGCMQAGTPQACSVPPSTGAAELGIRELHEFGKNYEVFEVVVKLDGCMFFRTEDTSVLGRPQVDIAPLPVTAGVHAVEIYTKFRSGPSADMHDYEWYEVEHLQNLELTANASRTLIIRRSEVVNRDPRKRMQTDISVE